MSEWLEPAGLLGVIAGSAFIGALATNWQSARQHRKEIVAGAIKSALRRREMYYRVKRRSATGEEDAILRDLFHDIQEENDRYIALLDMEAPWLGASYRAFLDAFKKELQPFMTSAWTPAGASGAAVQLMGESQPKVDHLVRTFTTDGRRLFNPLIRPLMRAKFSLRKFFKENKYETR